jgi:hypothetical protein
MIKILKNLHPFLKIFFEQKTFYHYELDLNSIKSFEGKIKFENRIFFSLDDMPEKFYKEILIKMGIKNGDTLDFKISGKSNIVVSSLKNELVSYCFFGFKKQKFRFFYLLENELYFFNCFTFPNYRGLGAIYSEVVFVINKYKEKGYKKANVEVESSNLNSINAFSKLGFVKTREYFYKRVFLFRKVIEKSFI